MFSEILELFKTPVTAMKKRAEERSVKKEVITVAIIAVVLAIVTVITSYISVIKSVNNGKTQMLRHFRFLSFQKKIKPKTRQNPIFII